RAVVPPRGHAPEASPPPEAISSRSRLPPFDSLKGRSPMIATNRNSADPPAEGTDQDWLPAAALTCTMYLVPDICEVAHREATNRPLWLNDAGIDVAEFRPHLKTCPPCQRFHRNARRAYARDSDDAADVILLPGAAGDPRPREAVPVR